MFRLQPPLPDHYSTATAEELVRRVTTARSLLGKRLVILGHHYQREEVIQFADMRGDSFGLSRFAAEQREAEFVVFCGVHFMAESADILTGAHQKVILPDLNAGCSMADMADLDAVEQIWEELSGVTDVEAIVPITYMNSAASLKAFVGRHSGAVCTSSNARSVLTWALEHASKVLFFPDQHLGRNTGFQLGYGASDMQVVDPRRRLGGLQDAEVKEATLLLWKGHCSVHQRFKTDHVEAFRAEHPNGVVIVHPECSREVVEVADQVGSTDYIIGAVAAARPASTLAIGTEIHLVDRLAREHPDKTVVSLDPLVCPCSTMFRIDLPHLAWVLDGLVEGEVRNRIVVDEATAADARVALERMLAIA
jgi:quinolinate synthase